MSKEEQLYNIVKDNIDLRCGFTCPYFNNKNDACNLFLEYMFCNLKDGKYYHCESCISIFGGE